MRYRHKHREVDKIWSDGKRDWLYGRFCDICGKQLKGKITLVKLNDPIQKNFKDKSNDN